MKSEYFKMTLVVMALILCAGLAAAIPRMEAASTPTKYRLSAAQVEAIQKAGPGAKVVLWEGAAPSGLKYSTTLWQSVNGARPLDEAHPCPPFDDC